MSQDVSYVPCFKMRVFFKELPSSIESVFQRIC